MGAIGHREVELPERQTANPPVVILHELPVDLHAMLLGQREVLALGLGKVFEPIDAGIHPAGMLPIGPGGNLHLEQPHVDPHLDHLAAVGCPDQTGSQHTRLKRPLVQDDVDVVPLIVVRFWHRNIIACSEPWD